VSVDGGGNPTEPAAQHASHSQEKQFQKDSARQNLFRWLKFNFVGGIGIFVQLAALALFRSVLHLNYLLATALAVETAVIHNFLWHERFTWKDRPSAHRLQSLTRFAKFNATNGAFSIAGNLLIMRALVHMNYLLANLIAVTVCSLLNFLLSDWVVFEREKPAPRSAEKPRSPAI
jgi:putative flippase GtrA